MPGRRKVYGRPSTFQVWAGQGDEFRAIRTHGGGGHFLVAVPRPAHAEYDKADESRVRSGIFSCSAMNDRSQTKVTLAGGQTIHVNEAASQVASQLRGKGFVKLQLADSREIYVNSAQVLYIEDVPDTPAA